jgi:hypothetical protein
MSQVVRFMLFSACLLAMAYLARQHSSYQVVSLDSTGTIAGTVKWSVTQHNCFSHSQRPRLSAAATCLFLNSEVSWRH